MAHLLLMVWLDDCTGGTSIRPPMNLKWMVIYVLNGLVPLVTKEEVTLHRLLGEATHMPCVCGEG
ncbi:MAG: hypothetical protein OJF52_004432 [Nitrospira sp.]|jgi:hypothetical protein|nr:MAG: hypothetical protein OJF52_004432 [Nitrospira sp.]